MVELNHWALRDIALRLDALSTVVPPQAHACRIELRQEGAYRLGYSCNLLNNSYIFARIARRMGAQATLILDPRFHDNEVSALPAWEEVQYAGEAMPAVDAPLFSEWPLPDFVQTALWDLKHQNIGFTGPDYELLRAAYGGKVAIAENDISQFFLYFNALGHKDLLQQYQDMDVLHVSGYHVGLASLAGKPYVTFPFGGDLYIEPFQNNERGWLYQRGFKCATRHIASGEIMLEYLHTLGVPKSRIDLLPFMMDTDIYSPQPGNPLRQALRRKYSGRVIFFVGARQNWNWKGSDKLWRAVAKALKREPNAMFLTVWYGQDSQRSLDLIRELGIENNVVRIGVLSKPSLRQHIDASDVCVDQFTLGGLGTFSLESLSIGKPLLTYYTPEKHFSSQATPPILSAFTVDEIADTLVQCVQGAAKLPELGTQSRAWAVENHGHEVLWPAYDATYRRALAQYHST